MLGIFLALIMTFSAAKASLTSPTSVLVYKKKAAKAMRRLRGSGAFSTGLARVALLVALTGFAKCQHPNDPYNWDIQPKQNVLVWETCDTLMERDFPDYDLWTSEVSDRITGGCGKMTFCNRGANNLYDDGLYGLRMESPNEDTDCVSPGPMLIFEPGFTYGLSKFDTSLPLVYIMFDHWHP